MKCIFMVLALFVSVQVSASEESKEIKLKELLQITNANEMIDSMYSQMEMMLQNMSSEMGVKDDEQEIFDEYYSKMMNVVRDSMSWDKMQPLVADLYIKNFTEKEISDMVEFYKTETGRSLLEKMPLVMQESMQIGQTLMQNAIPKIKSISAELAKDLEKHRSKTE